MRLRNILRKVSKWRPKQPKRPKVNRAAAVSTVSKAPTGGIVDDKSSSDDLLSYLGQR